MSFKLFMNLFLFSMTPHNYRIFYPVFFWYLNKVTSLSASRRHRIISHILEKGKPADRSKMRIHLLRGTVDSLKNEKLISEVLLRANSLLCFLPDRIYLNQIISHPCLNNIYLCKLYKFRIPTRKGQSIYSCDPHDLKLAGRLAKHSVMLKLFPEQQASLPANQLKRCQTSQPIFFQCTSFKTE